MSHVFPEACAYQKLTPTAIETIYTICLHELITVNQTVLYRHCKKLLMVFIIPLRNLSRERLGLKGGEREAVSHVAWSDCALTSSDKSPSSSSSKGQSHSLLGQATTTFNNFIYIVCQWLKSCKRGAQWSKQLDSRKEELRWHLWCLKMLSGWVHFCCPVLCWSVY